MTKLSVWRKDKHNLYMNNVLMNKRINKSTNKLETKAYGAISVFCYTVEQIRRTLENKYGWWEILKQLGRNDFYTRFDIPGSVVILGRGSRIQMSYVTAVWCHLYLVHLTMFVPTDLLARGQWPRPVAQRVFTNKAVIACTTNGRKIMSIIAKPISFIFWDCT